MIFSFMSASVEGTQLPFSNGILHFFNTQKCILHDLCARHLCNWTVGRMPWPQRKRPDLRSCQFRRQWGSQYDSSRARKERLMESEVQERGRGQREGHMRVLETLWQREVNAIQEISLEKLCDLSLTQVTALSKWGTCEAHSLVIHLFGV